MQACIRNPVLLDQVSASIYDDLVDEIVLGVAFEIHRCVKTGILQLLDNFDDTESGSEMPDPKCPVDVFGQVISTTSGVPALKKQPECVCPNCQRNLAASRFAPHLEKCMGMGRNSSRLASRRLANNSKESGSGQTGGAEEDDAEDEDWLEPSRALAASRKKRDKSSPRRNRGNRGQARWRTNEEEQHVDIDSFTEGDTAALRESLAQLSSSPAESTNSTSSNPSNHRGVGGSRRDKGRRGASGKKTRPGSKDGSRGSSPPLMYD